MILYGNFLQCRRVTGVVAMPGTRFMVLNIALLVSNIMPAAAQGAEAPLTPRTRRCEHEWSLPYRRPLPPGYPRHTRRAHEEPEQRLFMAHVVDAENTTFRALESLRGTDIAVVIIDNSDSGTMSDAASLTILQSTGFSVSVVTPIVPLTHPQTENAIQRLAYDRGLDIFWTMHSDATVSRGSSEMREFARAMHARTSWGLVFFNYDALTLYNPRATIATGVWDTVIFGYGDDVDYFHRMRLGGFEMLNADDIAVHHVGSYTINSASFECIRKMRFDMNDEGAYRHHYLSKKWGAVDPDPGRRAPFE